MKTILYLFAVLLISMMSTNCANGNKQKEETKMKYKGTVNAPEFPTNLEWLNTDKKLSIKELKGKVILIDFWTYCCINCIHILPDLSKLEHEFSNELVVIGVHSAKFKNEKESENIKQAIMRYRIEHPVINDNNFEVWSEYGARSWPTTVLINPRGKIIAVKSGEGVYNSFHETIAEVIKEFDSIGEIDRTPLNIIKERDKAPVSVLSYPGKIISDGEKLYISDSNNDRIVIANEKGKVLDIIGSGISGSKDGSFEQVQFDRPQGMAFSKKDNCLYIADTENHLIRKADFNDRTVQTIAGTGFQGSYSVRSGTGRGIALNSPWDLTLHGNVLFIAMAGQHQIWSMDTKTYKVQEYAGTGAENIFDGNLINAAFSQPSGIYEYKDALYIADSEVSAIRKIDIKSNKVETLIGRGLFDFGDVDGGISVARMQHALGLTVFNNLIYTADTYNHKIRTYNLDTKQLTTFAGTGKPGAKDETNLKAQFNEPSGLCILNGFLYVSDTNNGLIRKIDLKNNMVSTLVFSNPDKLKVSSQQVNDTLFQELNLNYNNKTITIKIELPKGRKINETSGIHIVAKCLDEKIKLNQNEFDSSENIINIPVQLINGQSLLNLSLEIFSCSEGNHGMCFYNHLDYRFKVNISNQQFDNTIHIKINK